MVHGEDDVAPGVSIAFDRPAGSSGPSPAGCGRSAGMLGIALAMIGFLGKGVD
jgi:hypothetical protein